MLFPVPSLTSWTQGSGAPVLKFAKLNWKLLLAVPLLVSCLMIGIGGPVRPIVLGCLLGVAIRILVSVLQSA
jgi:hypothetical protein